MLGTHRRLEGSPWSRRSLAAALALSIALVAGSTGAAPAAPAASARPARQPSAFTRQQRRTRKLARKLIVEPRLRAQNERWGWLTHRKAQRKARSQAHQAIDQSIERAQASGRLDQHAAKQLRTALRRELDQTSLDQVMAHDPELATGRRGWWSMLRRVSGAEQRPFSRLKLIVDGPEFRDAVHDLVGRADGFLHISGLEWNNDVEGRAFSQAIAARKLRMKPARLRGLLARGRTLTEIRDRRLAEAFAARARNLPLGAAIPEAQVREQLATIEHMPETARQQLVGVMLEPLEVRVLLSGMFQLKANRGRPKQPLLADLETVGGHVLFEHMPVQRRFPWFLPQNLYARVTHGKMVVSGDEAIAGGQNFGYKYMQPKDGPLVWHDASAAIQGKVVHGYTQSFIAHWNDTALAKGKKELVVDEGAIRPASREKLYYPPPRGPPRGTAAIAGTDERIGTRKATFTYRTSLRLALAGAKDSVVVTNPYFTSPWVAGELAATARRFRREGRDPSRIVLLLTKAADETLASSFLTNQYVHRLKKLGVTVLEFAPDAADGDYIDGAINHAKAWVVDGKVAYLGSANLTVRSMTQDWEMGVVTDDPAFVGEVQRRLLDVDRRRSRAAGSLWAPVRYLGYGLSLFFGPLLRAT